MNDGRHARQSFLGEFSESILTNLVVGLVGLGGGGSHFGQQLAHVGVGNHVLVDPDVVEESNLNRLVGATSEDAKSGVLKVKIAERLIKGINPFAHVQQIPAKWQVALDELRSCDVLVGCVDSFRQRDELERFARQSLIPYIDIGMDVHSYNDGYVVSGQVVLSSPGEICMRCMGIINDKLLAEEAKRYGDAGDRPQVIWPNGVLASTGVGVLVQLVTPWHNDPLSTAFLEYDGNTHTVQPSNRLRVLKGMKCPHHPCSEVGDRFW